MMVVLAAICPSLFDASPRLQRGNKIKEESEREQNKSSDIHKVTDKVTDKVTEETLASITVSAHPIILQTANNISPAVHIHS